MPNVDHTTLHRTAKLFMDTGRAATHEEALDLLKSFGLTIVVGEDARRSPAGQIALLTLVNLARRTFLAGVEVAGLGDALTLTNLSRSALLSEAVAELGGRPVEVPKAQWPVAVIGTVPQPNGEGPAWQLTWSGWRAGVVPVRDGWMLPAGPCMPLAPALAAAICAGEVFAFHAADHPLAGRRPVGLSLWRPGAKWDEPDASEPLLAFLPSRLWLIGLGNLGQAYSWLLACLPYENPAELELVLQDYDRLAVSNDSTSVLSSLDGLGRMKTRWVADWLEARGFTTFLEERRFGEWTRRHVDEPAVALCGVDNGPTRAALEDAGFELVIESGLGAGPQSFKNFSMHSFPSSRRANQIWSGQQAGAVPDVSVMPAYKDLKDKGLDTCGLAQLATRTVGVPFVGLISAVVVISELLRRLHGGTAHEVIAGSVASPEDLEVCPWGAEPYAYGHVAAKGTEAMPHAESA